MLDVIIGRHTWNCQIRTHINHVTEIHTHKHTQKQKTKKQKRCNDNQETTVSHFGENKRLHLESSKQNYYIISLCVIIKAIFIPDCVLHIPVSHDRRRACLFFRLVHQVFGALV